MRLYRPAFVILLLTAALSPSPTRAQGDDIAAGYVRSVSGTVRLIRGGTPSLAHVGDAVLPGDTLESDAGGTVGVTFRDDCRVSLGPRSHLDLRAFEFAPAKRRFSFIIRLGEGSLHYISGLIAKLAPGNAAIQTPSGTIAVRGTEFLLRIAAP